MEDFGAKLQFSLDSVMNFAEPCPGRTAMTALFLMFIHSFAQVTKMAHVSLAADYRMSREAKCIGTPLASMTWMAIVHPKTKNIDLSKFVNLQLLRLLLHFSVFTEAMVANYGMSDKIGLLNFGQNDASSQFYKPYSTLAKLATHKSKHQNWAKSFGKDIDT